MYARSRSLVALAMLGTMSLSLPVAKSAQPQPELKLSSVEQTLFDLTNEARTKEGLPALKLNPLLIESARAHSANMAKQGKLDHVLDDKDPADRAKDKGYRGRVGENIAGGKRLTPRAAFELWMDSKLHKENILRKEYCEIGIGADRTDEGEVYYTQVFGIPKGI
jgi:uncharacterized protein YkwD